MRCVVSLVTTLFFLLVLCPAALAAEYAWTFVSASEKYSKYYAPASVRVLQQMVPAAGTAPVATEITAEIKTTLSYAGAEETIRNYQIEHVIEDPGQLAYTIATVRVVPQQRTLQYINETFYDAAGNVLRSKAEGREKEMNSQQFDEEFYAVLVDTVFHQGELDRMHADDRWILLWSDDVVGGTRTQVTADTSTMRRMGDNLIFWAWTEVRDADGKALEIKFDKRAVNLPQGTERIVTGKYWSPAEGWHPLEDAYEGAYRMIHSESPEGRGLIRLRAFANGYVTWVKRYQLS